MQTLRIRVVALIVMTAMCFTLGVFLHEPLAAQGDEQSVAWLRFGHFADDSDSVTILVDGEPFLGSDSVLSFGTMSQWQRITPGNYIVTVSSMDDVQYPVTVNVDNWVTVVLSGSNESYQLSSITNSSSDLTESTSRIQVFHAMEDVMPVTLRLGDVPLFDSVEYGTDETADVETATYGLSITAAGESEVVLRDLGTLELLPRHNYVFIVYRIGDQTQVASFATDFDAPSSVVGMALLRFAHLSSGTTPVDVYINGELDTFFSVLFPEMVGWVALPAGSHVLTISPAGDAPDTALLSPLSLDLPTGTATTVALVGTEANDSLTTAVIQEPVVPLAPGLLYVEVFNAHPGMGPIDMVQLPEDVLVEALGYPGFFGGNDGYSRVMLEEGTYDFALLRSEDRETLASLPGTSLIAGRAYFIAVISANPPYYFTFRDLSEMQTLLEG